MANDIIYNGDTLFHSQKYFLALFMKVKLTPPQPTAPQAPPVKQIHESTPAHTHLKNAYRQIHCQNSYYKA